jgi:hypothetical protein
MEGNHDKKLCSEQEIIVKSRQLMLGLAEKRRSCAPEKGHTLHVMMHVFRFIYGRYTGKIR